MKEYIYEGSIEYSLSLENYLIQKLFLKQTISDKAHS